LIEKIKKIKKMKEIINYNKAKHDVWRYKKEKSYQIIIEIYCQIFNFIHFLIRLNQICPKRIKMDQTWSNWTSDEIIIEIYCQIFNFIYLLIRLNQICPKQIKMDQTWSNWISDEIIRSVQNGSKWISDEIIRSVQNGSISIQFQIWWNNQICPKRIKMDQKFLSI
jgi:hypothetical protein